MLTVVKIGGAWLEGGTKAEAFRDLADLPGDLVVVHGGGHEISRWLERIGGVVEWADGLRVTRGDGLQLTAMVLSGWVNKRIVAVLTNVGRPAVGISGEDGELIVAEPLDRNRYGEVGRVRAVDPTALFAILKGGFIPVVSPVSRGPGGLPLNVNADEAAIQVAKALEADRLLLISDVPGVLADGERIESLDREDATALVDRGTLVGGMRVKVEQALDAAAVGVEVRIGNEGLLAGAPGTWIRAQPQPDSDTTAVSEVKVVGTPNSSES